MASNGNKSSTNSDGDRCLLEIEDAFVEVDVDGNVSDSLDECELLGVGTVSETTGAVASTITLDSHAPLESTCIADAVAEERVHEPMDVDMIEDNPVVTGAEGQGSRTSDPCYEGHSLEGSKSTLEEQPVVEYPFRDFRLQKEDGSYYTPEEVASGSYKLKDTNTRKVTASSGSAGGSPQVQPVAEVPTVSEAKSIKKAKVKRVCPICHKVVPRIKIHVHAEHFPGCMKDDTSKDINVLPTKPSVLHQVINLVYRRMRLADLDHLLSTIRQRELHPATHTQLSDQEKAQVDAYAQYVGEKPGKAHYQVHKPDTKGILCHWRLLMSCMGTLSQEDQADVRRFVPQAEGVDAPPAHKSSTGSSEAAGKSATVGKAGSRRSATGEGSAGASKDSGEPPNKKGKPSGAGVATVHKSSGPMPAQSQTKEKSKSKETSKGKSKETPKEKSKGKSKDKSKEKSKDKSHKSRKSEPEHMVVVKLDKGSAHRMVDYVPPTKKPATTTPPLPPFVGVDTHFHPDMLMKQTGKNSLAEALATLPVSEGFQLEKAICIYCFPKSYPDPYQRIELRKDSRLLYAYGWHPKALDGHNDPYTFEVLDSLCGTKDCVTMGEIGLDYTVNQPKESRQKKMLKELLRIARRRKLPVIIHCRDRPNQHRASDDCVKILTEALPKGHTVIRHCLDGDKDQFLKWKEEIPGCYFSIAGLATKESCNPQLSLVIDRIPDDRLLLETDAPYLLPAGVKNTTTNSPNLLLEVAKYVAHIREDVRVDDIYGDTRSAHKLRRLLESTAANARKCFRY